MAVALVTDALTTQAECKRHMKISVATYDDLINQLINGASLNIEKYLNRKLVAQAYTSEKYDGDGEKRLYTKNFPINTVTSLILYEPQTDTDLYTYTVNDEYIIHGEKQYIYMWGGVPEGTQNIKITYNAGYATLPEDIKLACNIFVSIMYSALRRENTTSISVGTYSEAFSKIGSKIPDEVTQIIDVYRQPNI